MTCVYIGSLTLLVIGPVVYKLMFNKLNTFTYMYLNIMYVYMQWQ